MAPEGPCMEANQCGQWEGSRRGIKVAGRTGDRWLCPRPGASHFSVWASVSPFANDQIVGIPSDSDSLGSQKRLEVVGHLFSFSHGKLLQGPQGQTILEKIPSSHLSEVELMCGTAQVASWWW